MKKVLIIEDNIEIRENTAELLEFSNYSVITAENGNVGFELAKKYRPDVILCDMMMPDSDGREFLKLAKEDEFVRNIPLVFFSAGSLTPDIRRDLTKAASDYLQKPFTEQELIISMEKALDKKNDGLSFSSTSK